MYFLDFVLYEYSSFSSSQKLFLHFGNWKNHSKLKLIQSYFGDQKLSESWDSTNETTLSDINYVREFQETDPLEEDERYKSPYGSKEKNSIMSHGLIIRNQSIIDGIPKFVSFNNKFLHKLGCQFYFKDTGRVIKIFSYSKKGDKLQYKLRLESKKSGKSSTVKAVVGEKINIAAYDFDSDIIEYELVVNMP